MTARTLEIVTLAPIEVDAELPEWLGQVLEKRWGLRVKHGPSLPLWAGAWDPSRQQFSSDLLLDALIARDERGRIDPSERWVLALTAKDIFGSCRNYVFGEATQGGAWALVSLARLLPSTAAGDPQGLLRRRALKEVVHELGHLAGLSHCDRADCVMSASVDVASVDHKSSSCCPACRLQAQARENRRP